MIEVFGVHGVNHGPEEQKSFAAWWQRYLEEVGVACHVHPGSWSSTGSAPKDWYSHWRRGVFEGHLAEVEVELRRWAADTRDAKSRVLLAHSWGTMLLYNVLVRRPEFAVIPAIMFGSPFTQGYIGRRLRWAGRAPRWHFKGVRPLLFQNRDDLITHLHPAFGPAATTGAPDGFITEWVDVPGQPLIEPVAGQLGGVVGEHGVELYLQHPRVLEAISRRTR